ncbi:uncharacterized protein C6orf136 homolog [Adelges cooleyi]|uniref:uncharacterized protein C6orf136 homolog n=1 Tax=Adelges cooleyi TaxID=133065 RepID=UPI00217F414E|nr:uncharacterized protein C6orf136 homolog [Adelges cooleyi]
MANAVRKICTKIGNGHQYLSGSNKALTYGQWMTDIIQPLSASQHAKILPCNLLHPLGSVGQQMANKHSLKNSVIWYKRNNCTRTSVLPLGDLKKAMVQLSSNPISPDKREESNPRDQPTAEQLEFMQNNLVEDLPKLFKENINYSLYHPKLVFENNIRGTKSVGLHYFMTSISLLRIMGHLKYAFVKLDVLKATKHPEDGTVKIRWRIKGISGFKVFMKFWKFKFWDFENAIKQNIETWHDGFSVFYLGGDGLVHKLTVDKMQPDDNTVLETKNPLAAKLALFVGLTQHADSLSYYHMPLDIIEHTELLNLIIMSLEDAL